MLRQDNDTSLDQLLLEPLPFSGAPDDAELFQPTSAMPILGGRFSMRKRASNNTSTTRTVEMESFMQTVNPDRFTTYNQYASQGNSSSYLDHHGLHQRGIESRMPSTAIDATTSTCSRRETSVSRPMIIRAPWNPNAYDPNPTLAMQMSTNQQLLQLFQDGNSQCLQQESHQHNHQMDHSPTTSRGCNTTDSQTCASSSLHGTKAMMADAFPDDIYRFNGDHSADLAIPIHDGGGVLVAPLRRGGGSSTPPKHSRQGNTTMRQFRLHQCEHWNDRFAELVAYHEKHGHCLVPNAFKQNVPLAEWVKRQRYQYKLKQLGQHSSMTEERMGALESLGFVWNSHDQTWEERLNDLKKYKSLKGDCDVRTGYPPNPQLGIWVKRQRRQFKLLSEGKTSTMTPYRLQKLNEVGFSWHVLSGRKRSDKMSQIRPGDR